MNKKILLLILFGLLFLPVASSAIDNPIKNPTGVTVTSIDKLIDSLADIAWKVFAVIAVIMFVVAGVAFLTAQGDATKLTTARSAFLWGVAGVVVGIIAFSIITIVGTLIGGSGGS